MTPEEKAAHDRARKLAALRRLAAALGRKFDLAGALKQVDEKYPLPVGGDGQSQ